MDEKRRRKAPFFMSAKQFRNASCQYGVNTMSNRKQTTVAPVQSEQVNAVDSVIAAFAALSDDDRLNVLSAALASMAPDSVRSILPESTLRALAPQRAPGRDWIGDAVATIGDWIAGAVTAENPAPAYRVSELLALKIGRAVIVNRAGVEAGAYSVGPLFVTLNSADPETGLHDMSGARQIGEGVKVVAAKGHKGKAPGSAFKPMATQAPTQAPQGEAPQG